MSKNNMQIHLPIKQEYKGDHFHVHGYANVPLDQNWAKRPESGYGPNMIRDNYRGWAMTGEIRDPANVQIRFGNIDQLATPNTMPLDAVTLHGFKTTPEVTLGDFGISNQTIERTDFSFLALVLYHDLETKDPMQTKGWVSMDVADWQKDTTQLRNFKQIIVSHYFNADLLKKRITRFNKQLSATFK